MTSPFSFKAYISKVGGDENCGTSLVKYSPTVGKDVTVQSGRTRNIDVKYNCITFIKEYEDKSLEELRLEDYRSGRVSKEAILGNFIYRFNTNGVPASNPRSLVKKTGAVLAYEVLSKRFETKIFIPKKRCGVGEQSNGTSLVKYRPKVDTDVIIKFGDFENINVKIICITAMNEYEDKSLEELRLEDYKAGRKLLTKYIKYFDETDPTTKPSIFVFGFKHNYAFSFRDREQIDTDIGEHSGTSLVKYRPKVETDVILKHGELENINVKIICITAMKEYKNKSMEELRLEDYKAGRKPLAKYPLKFHSVHGENIKLSNDRTIAERTYSHYGGVAFTSRPIRVNEKIYLRLIKISKNWATLSGMCFGFTTDNPNGIAHSVPIFGTSLKNSWITHLNKELCKKDTILHYYVNPIGELRFGVNGQIQNEIMTKIDIGKPLWAVIDVYGRCKMVQFVGPEALDEVKQPDQVVEQSRGSNQIVGRSNQVVDRATQHTQIREQARGSNQIVKRSNQVEDRATQPTQIREQARGSNQIVKRSNQVVDRATQPTQIREQARGSNQIVGRSYQVVDRATQPTQIREQARGSNQIVKRSNQVVDRATQPTQIGEEARESNQIVERSNQVVDGDTKPNQVEDRDSKPNQVVDESKGSNEIVERFNQVVNGAIRTNQSLIEHGLNQVKDEIRQIYKILDDDRRPNLIGDGPRRSNHFAERTRQSNQIVVGARRPNQVVDGARRSDQVVNEARRSIQNVDGISRPNQTSDGARRSNQIVDGVKQPNQIVDGVKRPNQVVDRPNLNQEEVDPLINELRSLSVGEPFREFYTDRIPLSLHKTKGRNVYIIDTGIVVRYPREYCQGYVFTARPMPLGRTITIKVLNIADTKRGSLAVGLTSCDPASLRPDELPDSADFLLDRPEYWVVYLDAATGLGINDELKVTLTLDGKLEIRRNGRDLVAVLHVDHTLKLWAFFDIYGDTKEVRLFISKGVGNQDLDEVSSDQDSDEVSSEQDLVEVSSGRGLVENSSGRGLVEVSSGRGLVEVSSGQGLVEVRSGQDLVEVSPSQDWDEFSPDEDSDEVSPDESLVRGIRYHQGFDMVRPQPALKTRIKQTKVKEKAENLPSTSKSQNSAKNADFARTECTICFDNQINSVLYKCGHMCMCYDCAVQQWKNHGNSYGKCPLCRAKILDVIRTYKP